MIFCATFSSTASTPVACLQRGGFRYGELDHVAGDVELGLHSAPLFDGQQPDLGLVPQTGALNADWQSPFQRPVAPHKPERHGPDIFLGIDDAEPSTFEGVE
jgi:hypothetical protein